MPENLIFRMATPGDDRRLLELFRAAFGRELSATWWHWFSYLCPTGRNRTAVVEDPERGRLAGSYSLLPIRLWLNGRETKASLCTLVNTHPDYRGQGLFTRVGEYALSQERTYHTPVSLGMPNANALPGHLKVGWEVPFMLPFLVKTNCQARRHHCVEVPSFDRRVDKLVAELKERFRFLVLKDHAFLNWRLVARPDKQYTRFALESDGNLEGYVVLKHFDDKGYRKSHILDIQARSDGALRELIAAAETFAQGRDELNMWTNRGDPYRNAFLEEGFSIRERNDRLILHTNYGAREPIQQGAWWFCLADNDVY